MSPHRSVDDHAASREQQRTRRRFIRRQWARRWGLWKYAVIGLLLAALTGVAGYVLAFSERTSVQQITVSGNDYASAAEVRRAAAVPVGQQLLFVDLDRARARVASLPAVASAQVLRDWPDQIVIKVAERIPVALVSVGGSWRGMDAEGVVFRDYARPPGNLPRVQVTSDADQDALAESARIIDALPDALARRVDHLQVSTIDKIELVLRDQRVVEWGSAEQTGRKAEVLSALMTAQPDAASYDVSVPDQPVVRRP